MSVITIARQLGAGGKTVGEKVAKELGYAFFDNEIIQMVAEKAKVSNEVVETLEKDTGGKFFKFFAGLVPKNFADRVEEAEPGSLTEVIYVDLLHKIIKQIADSGDVVILGRGSQYILHDMPETYHVLLTANDDHRMKFLGKRYNLRPDEAVRAIKVEDKRREKLYKSFGRDDYDSFYNYHLILNMAKTDMDMAVSQICTMVTD